MNKRTRKVGAKIYVLCNGELAEPQYFEEFKDQLAIPQQIIVRYKPFIHMAPWDFIKAAIAYRKELAEKDKFSAGYGDQIWCVFDIDNYWKDNKKDFGAALELAKKNKINLAWSNQCFELWYLCHFDATLSAMPRTDYHKKLKDRFKTNSLGNYSKNMKGVFELLRPFQHAGIKNAKKLYVKDNVGKDPSTAVYLLVEEMNNLSK